MGKFEKYNAVEESLLFTTSILREKIGLALKENPHLKLNDIFDIAFVNRVNLSNLFKNEFPKERGLPDALYGTVQGILNHAISPEASGESNENILANDIPLNLYKPLVRKGRVPRRSSQGKKYLLHQENFREYIHFLRSEFHGLGEADFEKRLGLKSGRIKQLLRREENVCIFLDEADRLRQLYFQLEKSRDSYRLKRVKLDRKAFNYLIFQIQEKYNITIAQLADYLQIKPMRLETIMRSGKTISGDEDRKFDELEARFEMDRLPFAVSESQNSIALADRIKIEFFPITEQRIEQLCLMRTGVLGFIRRGHQHNLPEYQTNKLLKLSKRPRSVPSLRQDPDPSKKQRCPINWMRLAEEESYQTIAEHLLTLKPRGYPHKDQWGIGSIEHWKTNEDANWGRSFYHILGKVSSGNPFEWFKKNLLGYFPDTWQKNFRQQKKRA